MKLTKIAVEELRKRVGKLVEIHFESHGLIGNGYCGTLLEFNNESMTFKGLSGIKIVNLRNVTDITLEGKHQVG